MMEKMLLIGMTYVLVWSSCLCLALTLFRFKLIRFSTQLIFSTLLLANISVVLQMTDLVYLLALLQFLSSFLCLWLIFKIPMKHAILMTLFMILISMSLEWLETFIYPQMFVQIVTEENMLQFFLGGLVLSSSVWCLAILLQITRLGFSFIPQSNHRTKLQFTGSNSLKIALWSGLFILIVSSLINYLYPKALFTFSLFLTVPLALLFRISYHWEAAE